eukprot:s2430_g11.t2
MWRPLMVLFPVHALRTEVGDAESVGQTGYSLPRRCSHGYFSSSHCCSCSEINGQRLEPELGAVIDTCEWVTKDGVVHGKPCCAVWAVDCKEEEPQFQRGLNRDCIVTKEECANSECSDVYKELASARHALAKAKRDRPQRKSWEEQGMVSGKSNSRWMCPCACGDIVDLDPKQMTCKSLNEKAIVCPSVRACCSDLVECDADAPWPEAVRNDTAEVSSLRSGSEERIKQLRRQVTILEGLSDECYDSCSIAHKKVCLNDLQAVVKSGMLGKDVTQQEADAQMQMTAMATSAATSREARDKLIQDLNDEHRSFAVAMKNHARDLERQRAWREKQLIKLASFRDRLKRIAYHCWARRHSWSTSAPLALVMCIKVCARKWTKASAASAVQAVRRITATTLMGASDCILDSETALDCNARSVPTSVVLLPMVTADVKKRAVA